MKEAYCQSCAMPMAGNDELFGTNADGSKNEEYCIYCYKDGNFTNDCTMEEMIEFCIPHMVEGNSGMSEDEARKMMNQFMPQLKRWR